MRPQDTELMSSGYLGVTLPGRLDVLLTGLTDTWDQKGERARHSATVNAKHQGRVNCVNQSVLIRFSIKEEMFMLA